MGTKNKTFITLSGTGTYLGTFETFELARLFGDEHSSVVHPVRNYPDKDKTLQGNFSHSRTPISGICSGTGTCACSKEDAGPILETPPEPVSETPPEPVSETPFEPALETAPEPVSETPPEPAPETPKKRVRLTEDRIQECCDKVLASMTPGQPYKRKGFLEDLDIMPNEWTKTIRSLLDSGSLRQEGVKKGAVYFLSGDVAETVTETVTETVAETVAETGAEPVTETVVAETVTETENSEDAEPSMAQIASMASKASTRETTLGD